MVKAQHGIVLMTAQKQALLDETCGRTDQRNRMHLRLATTSRAHTGSVEYRDDTPIRIVNRCRGAGQTDVPRAEMIRLMDRDGTRLGCAGANAIRTLALLAPLCTDDQPRLNEHPLQNWIDL